MRDRVSVLHGSKVPARGELRGMAGDAELGLRMGHGVAQRRRSPARRIGVPAVPEVDEKIHPGPNGQTGILVRRRIIFAGAQLVHGVIGGNPQVVGFPGLQDARAKFVEAGKVLRRLGEVFKLAETAGYYIFLAGGRIPGKLEDFDVYGNLAVENIEREIHELRAGLLECEFEPLKSPQQGPIGVFRRRRNESAFVVGAEDRLPELEFLRLLPRRIGQRRNNGIAVSRELQRPAGHADSYSLGTGTPVQLHMSVAGGAGAKCDIEVEISGMQDLAGDQTARIGDRRLDLAAPAEAIRGIDRDRYAVKFTGFESFQRKFILLGARRKHGCGQKEAKDKKGCEDFQCHIGFHKA